MRTPRLAQKRIGMSMILASDPCFQQGRFLAAHRRGQTAPISSSDRPFLSGPVNINFRPENVTLSPAPYAAELNKVIDIARANNPKMDTAIIEKAFSLAWQGHNAQFRKSGEPYIIHPLAVAKLLAIQGRKPDVIAAGLCHDLIEDGRISGSKITKKYLAKELNRRVALLVDGVTMLGKDEDLFPPPSIIEIYKKFIRLASRDFEIILIKLADRLHNMRTLQHMSERSQIKNAEETMKVYTPFADRLGMWDMKRELEDLSFKYLDRARFEAILSKRSEIIRESETRIRTVQDDVAAALKRKGIYVSVKIEIRSVYELEQRMALRKVGLNELFSSDIWRVQIVAPDQDQCYLALGTLHQIYSPIADELKDYIGDPRPNGHQFLQTYADVPGHGRVLFQIRDIEMKRTYHLGIITKMNTKAEGKAPWITFLVQYLTDLGDTLDVTELWHEIAAIQAEIKTRSPQGKVIGLPVNSTPLDFARSIHSGLFLHASEAIVNGRKVPLTYILKNGDTVEIVKSAHLKASLSWLRSLRTHEARQTLRAYLRKMPKATATKAARKLLEAEAEKFHMTFDDLINTVIFKKYIERNYKNINNFMEQVGNGNIRIEKIASDFIKEYSRYLRATSEKEVFTLRVTANDRVGLLEDILRHIKSLNINLKSGAFAVSQARGKKQRTTILLSAEIASNEAGHIQMLQIRHIAQNTNGVISAEPAI